MTPESWWTIKVICGGIAGVFALLAAVFSLLDVVYWDRQGRVKAWFRAKWEGVGRSRWVNMPEHVIRFFVIGAKRWPAALLKLPEGRWSTPTLLLSILSIVGGGTAICYVVWGLLPAILYAVSILPLGMFLLSAYLDNIGYAAPEFLKYVEKLPDKLFLAYVLSVCTTSATITMYAVVTAPLSYAVPLAVIFVPVYWVTIGYPLVAGILIRIKGGRDEYKENFAFVLCAGIGLSFAVTLAAFLIGHVASPAAWIPQTSEMLTSNFICDGLTLGATFFILQRALAHPTLRRIVFAVIVDFLVAGILACLSLYLGLFTSKALTVGETLNVLVGLSPDGTHAEVGPYFWAMHTTFLPTLAYLGLILAACMGKALLIPVRWFFGVGYKKGPLKLTVVLLALFAGLFWVPSYVAGIAEERAKKTPTTHKATSIPATSSRARATARAVGVGRWGDFRQPRHLLI